MLTECVDTDVAIDPEGMRAYLTRHHWPCGLQEATLRSLYNIPKRYFIVGMLSLVAGVIM